MKEVQHEGQKGREQRGNQRMNREGERSGKDERSSDDRMREGDRSKCFEKSRAG